MTIEEAKDLWSFNKGWWDVDLKLTLELHAKWLNNEEGGVRADLRGANLQGADLQEADLRGADLQGAYLQGADMQEADLQEADLQEADLQGADLRGANLRGADLQGADMQVANLDFSAWPLRCGSFHAKADIRLVAQLAKHLAMLDVSGCCGGIQEAMSEFRKTGLAHLFDEFRDDLDKTPSES